MKRTLAIIICFLSLLLPACARKKSRAFSFSVAHSEPQVLSEAQRAQSLALLRDWEATLLDIPFPLGAMPVTQEYAKNSETKGQHFLAYTTLLAESNLIAFYEQEMERLGWQKMVVLPDFETMLIFSKPDRICSISLRAASGDEAGTGSETERTLVVLSLGKKTQVSSHAQTSGNYDEDLWG